MYPSLTIEDYPDNRTLGFDIIATNSFSTQFLNVTVENVNIEPEISPGFVLLIFLSILFFIYITLYVLIYLIQSTKEKEVVADRRSRSGEFSSKLKQIEAQRSDMSIKTNKNHRPFHVPQSEIKKNGSFDVKENANRDPSEYKQGYNISSITFGERPKNRRSLHITQSSLIQYDSDEDSSKKEKESLIVSADSHLPTFNINSTQK